MFHQDRSFNGIGNNEQNCIAGSSEFRKQKMGMFLDSPVTQHQHHLLREKSCWVSSGAPGAQWVRGGVKMQHLVETELLNSSMPCPFPFLLGE